MKFTQFIITASISIGVMAFSEEVSADARYEANPALKALYEVDVERAQDVLSKLDEILAMPVSALPKTQSRSGDATVDDLADTPVLLENPTLMDAYRRDPQATAKLIGIIRPAVQ